MPVIPDSRQVAPAIPSGGRGVAAPKSPDSIAAPNLGRPVKLDWATDTSLQSQARAGEYKVKMDAIKRQSNIALFKTVGNAVVTGMQVKQQMNDKAERLAIDKAEIEHMSFQQQFENDLASSGRTDFDNWQEEYATASKAKVSELSQTLKTEHGKELFSMSADLNQLKRQNTLQKDINNRKDAWAISELESSGEKLISYALDTGDVDTAVRQFSEAADATSQNTIGVDKTKFVDAKKTFAVKLAEGLLDVNEQNPAARVAMLKDGGSLSTILPENKRVKLLNQATKDLKMEITDGKADSLVRRYANGEISAADMQYAVDAETDPESRDLLISSIQTRQNKQEFMDNLTRSDSYNLWDLRVDKENVSLKRIPEVIWESFTAGQRNSLEATAGMTYYGSMTPTVEDVDIMTTLQAKITGDGITPGVSVATLIADGETAGLKPSEMSSLFSLEKTVADRLGDTSPQTLITALTERGTPKDYSEAYLVLQENKQLFTTLGNYASLEKEIIAGMNGEAIPINGSLTQQAWVSKYTKQMGVTDESHILNIEMGVHKQMQAMEAAGKPMTELEVQDWVRSKAFEVIEEDWAIDKPAYVDSTKLDAATLEDVKRIDPEGYWATLKRLQDSGAVDLTSEEMLRDYLRFSEQSGAGGFK